MAVRFRVKFPSGDEFDLTTNDTNVEALAQDLDTVGYVSGVRRPNNGASADNKSVVVTVNGVAITEIE